MVSEWVSEWRKGSASITLYHHHYHRHQHQPPIQYNKANAVQSKTTWNAHGISRTTKELHLYSLTISNSMGPHLFSSSLFYSPSLLQSFNVHIFNVRLVLISWWFLITFFCVWWSFFLVCFFVVFVLWGGETNRTMGRTHWHRSSKCKSI